MDSSPFDSSPFAAKFNFGSNSPHDYWKNRDSTSSPTRSNAENRDPRDGGSPAPAKRSSIENLKRASRVKNSSMFARAQQHEYAPASVPVVERPLAAGRPFLASAFVGGKPADVAPQQTEEPRSVPSLSNSPSKVAAPVEEPASLQGRGQSSPSKSSLSKNSRYGHSFGPDAMRMLEEEESFMERQLPEGKSLRRHAKSVTFDVAPPQINEYEMTTPDPSSVASGSREGSYESLDGDDDESSEQHSVASREDSFDAALEDTDKTPVVLPEDWRFMSPQVANEDLAEQDDDAFGTPSSSPAPNANLHPVDLRMSPTRTDSLGSNGERRPLPPLPPLSDLAPPTFPRARSDSNSSLHAAAEAAAAASPKSPPAPRPASLTKSELQGLGGPTMSLEDRLKLMMIQEEERTQSMRAANEEQRERRMRRAAGSPSQSIEHSREIKIHEDEPEDDDVAGLGEFKMPPKINRESILRKVKTHTRELEDYSSPAPEVASHSTSQLHLDPDVPIPSTEDRPQPTVADDGVVIKEEESERVDVYAIPVMYRDQPMGSGDSSRVCSGGEDAPGEPQIKQEVDAESQSSSDFVNEEAIAQRAAEENSGVPTPRAGSPAQHEQRETEYGGKRMSLSQFASLLGQDDFATSLSTYMTPSPPNNEPVRADKSAFPAPLLSAPVERPSTPVEQTRPLTADSLPEPTTPDSVIRHRVSGESVQEQEVAPEPVPEPVSTIKASGGRLKTRPSLAPADIETMAETRRKVSGEEPPVPRIPDKHLLLHRPSTIAEKDTPRPSTSGTSGSEDDAKSGKRKSSLLALDVTMDEIDEGLSIGLDKEFDRLIEAQKVAFDSLLHKSDCPPMSSQDSSQLMSAEHRVPRDYHYDPHYHRRGRDAAWYTQNLANINLRRQKGYLMRQNTKMVVASSASHDSASSDATVAAAASASSEAPNARARATRSAGNSPVKAGQPGGAWTTEPWNGRVRRKSIRQSAGSPMKPPALSGAVPPLPGTQSAVATDIQETLPEGDEGQEGKERGRLFVKVVGVKDLDLPLPRGRSRTRVCSRGS